jgi:signal transduction histidine kinase/CheY-like chemotaxis protein/HAMP domain-containing protein
LESNESTPQKVFGTLYAEISIVEKLNDAHDEAVLHSLLYSSFMAIGSLFLGLILHVLISRRLRFLTDSANQISCGNLDVQSDIGGNDELSDLGKSFGIMVNQMKKEADARETAQVGLLELNNSLEERIVEHTQILEEAQRIAKTGDWQRNMRDDSLSWSNETYRIFGLNPKEGDISYEKFIERVHPADVEKWTASMDLLLRNKERFIVYHRILLPDENIKWVREEAIPKLDDNGEIIKIMGIVQDVDDHMKEMDGREKLEQQLRQTQKMEALGQLTGGVAHDFNNLLASIRGFTELAMELKITDERGKMSAYLEHIHKSSNQAAELVAQMLTFSRKEAADQDNVVIDLNEVLDSFQVMIRSLIPSTVSIDVSCEEGVPNVFGNETLLEQVLINLCVNAKDSLSVEQGKLIINTKKYVANECSCSSCHHRFSGDFVEISVTDNGSGISEDVLASLFEPFFTTKEVGKGTGMGLAMVHGIIHKHDGHIIVDSVEGKGSSFRILLPVTRRNKNSGSDDKPTPVTEINHNSHKYHILVVDDEPSITALIRELLEDVGYRVTTKNSSVEALAFFKDNADDVDMVITDYTMPEMHGTQLALAMMNVKRSIPVVLCTGYSERVDEEKAAELNFKAFIKKPIDMKRLLEILERELMTVS